MPIRFQSTYLDKYPLEIVGESFNQKALNDIVGWVDDDEKRYKEDSFIANLILENDNPYDPNAVKIDIEGKTVGHLSKSNAVKYRKAIVTLGKGSEIGQCYAAIYGKRDRETEEMNFGVWLDLDLSDMTILPTPTNVQEESKSKPIISNSGLSISVFDSFKSIFAKKKK